MIILRYDTTVVEVEVEVEVEVDIVICECLFDVFI